MKVENTHNGKIDSTYLKLTYDVIQKKISNVQMDNPPQTAIQQYLASTPFPLSFFNFHLSPDGSKSPTIQGYYHAHKYCPKVVAGVMDQSGFKASDNYCECEIIVGSKQPEEMINSLRAYQKISHFAKSFSIGTKSGLHRRIQALSAKLENQQPFYLPTYLLPDEYDKLEANFSSNPLWIQKPVGRCNGKGIKIINELPLNDPLSHTVVQKLVQYPVTIDGHKMDARFYAAVISVDPLIINVYEDGIIRIAPEPYDENSTQLGVHLTNYDGCRIETFEKLWKTLEENKLDPTEIKTKVEDAIAAVICTAREDFRSQKNWRNSFELYGFDFIFSLDGGVFVLEANVTPSMGFVSKKEEIMKMRMICDLLNLSCVTKETVDFEKVMSVLNEGENKDLVDFFNILNFETMEGRKGGFQCIYPVSGRSSSCTKFLEQASQNDTNLATWVSLSEEKKADRIKAYSKIYQKTFA